jgi:predicted Rossmann fold flavoprotein
MAQGSKTGKTVIVVGGGAAGLVACGHLAERGFRVVLIEKNAKMGRKLRITGKGRCNITNAADIEDFFLQIPTHPKFLYSALYTFTNEDMVRLMQRLGVKTKTERGGRVFPESDRAQDVVDALVRYAKSGDVKILHAQVQKLLLKEHRAIGVKTDAGDVLADAVVLATGGCSYPLTGSNGDGYRIAGAVGHTVVPPRPSLIPLVIQEDWVKELMGLALKNVSLCILDAKNKKIYEDFGEMLFTHFGVSGPIVLSASAHMQDPAKQKYILEIDLKPALTDKQLDTRLIREFEANAKKHLVNVLDSLLPKTLIPVIISLWGQPIHKEAGGVTRQERLELVSLLKHLQLHPCAFRPIEEAIITSGGIATKEINPSTMESKLVQGLYFAGEMIDVDAYTGGYNLQIAFSTGYLAAESIE